MRLIDPGREATRIAVHAESVGGKQESRRPKAPLSWQGDVGLMRRTLGAGDGSVLQLRNEIPP